MRTVLKTVTQELKIPEAADAVLTITDSGPGSDPPHQKNIMLTSSSDPSISLNVTDLVTPETKQFLQSLIEGLCGVYESNKDAEIAAKTAELQAAAAAAVEP